MSELAHTFRLPVRLVRQHPHLSLQQPNPLAPDQVVAINQFASDTQAELEAVKSAGKRSKTFSEGFAEEKKINVFFCNAALAAGATAAVICNHHGLVSLRQVLEAEPRLSPP